VRDVYPGAAVVVLRVPHTAWTQSPCDWRKSGNRGRDGRGSGDSPLPVYANWWSPGRDRRRLFVAGLYTDMGGGHDGGGRLDRRWTGRLRYVGPAARNGRSVPVRLRRRIPAARAGSRQRRAVVLSKHAAIPVYGHRGGALERGAASTPV